MSEENKPRRHASKWSLVVGLVILVAVAMSCRNNGDGDSSPEAADVDLVTLDGEPTSIADELGSRPLLASLWAIWCQPCRRELPELQRIATSNAGVDVLAVNIGDDPDGIRSYFEDMALQLPVAIDDVGDLLTALDVGTVPATVLFGSDGTILWSHLGAVTANQVDDALDTYVG